MNKIAKIDNSVAVVSKLGGSAIEKRQAMMQIESVNDSLNMIEKSIFQASTKKPINSLDKNKLLADIPKFLKFLSKDLGLKSALDDYDVARFFDVITRYYGDLCFSEIKIAFEMAMLGELDAYLPKDSNGNANANHYQSLSFEYVSKIMKAYKKKRNSVFVKAYAAVPTVKAIPEHHKEKSNSEFLGQLQMIVLKYKYTGSIEMLVIEEKMLFEKLNKVGLAQDVFISDEDQKKAYYQLIGSSLLSKMQKEMISTKGNSHDQVKFRSFILARKKEIVKALDYCINKEIQIKNILK